MELERYRALLCAIEQGSLSAAAEQLGYTPSGISRMMASLESEHGFDLLVRGREGVAPTQSCQQMLPVMRELLFSADKLTQLSAQIRGADIGTVVVGTAYNACYGWLSGVTSAFHRRYPAIRIEFCSDYSTQLCRRLARHEVDLCIISRREGEHEWLPFRRDPLMAMVPGEHPLAKAERVPLSAFAVEPYIETYAGLDIDNARVFAKYGIRPNTQFSTSDIQATYAMVEAGLGISMNNAYNSRLWAGSVKFLPLDPPQLVEIGIAADPAMSPAARTFLNFAQPYLRELAE